MDYRAYLVDTENGHFVGIREIEAPDDEAALANAQQYVDGRDVEVWLRARRVGRITAPDRQKKDAG